MTFPPTLQSQRIFHGQGLFIPNEPDAVQLKSESALCLPMRLLLESGDYYPTNRSEFPLPMDRPVWCGALQLASC